MKLENQLVCLELSQKIEKLGVKQESLWWWYDYENNNEWCLDYRTTFGIADKEVTKISAFTVAELGEMLPEYYPSHKTYMKDNPFICFDFGERRPSPPYQYANTEIDSRAKMFIYLIKKGLVKL